MTLTIQLTPEQSLLLAREAEHRGISREALALESLSERLTGFEPTLEWTPSSALAFWEASEMPSPFQSGGDGPEVARTIRRNAEWRPARSRK